MVGRALGFGFRHSDLHLAFASISARAPFERAPVIHRKLWFSEYGVDMAEAVFKKSAVAGSKF